MKVSNVAVLDLPLQNRTKRTAIVLIIMALLLVVTAIPW